LYLYGSQYPGGKALNFNAFTAAPIDPVTMLEEQGNLGRNALRGFPAAQWDFAVRRQFPITEVLKLQFRAEFFNILNHPNFAPESVSTGTVNSTDQISAFDKLNGNSAFGTFRAGQAADPRVAQLAIKVFF